jgi:hypothetical protein
MAGTTTHAGHNDRVTGSHRQPETPEELAARRRRHTAIAVAILLAGVLALGGMVWWQETRYDDYGRDVGCALSQARGQDDPDCD